MSFKMSDLGTNQATTKVDREVNYYWKKYDFTKGRTYSQVLSDHPYCQDPSKYCN